MVQAETQAELDRYQAKPTENGGREVQCGWLVDKYGLSWQIDPTQLRGLLSDKNGEKSGRAMLAMRGMKKLALAKLQAALDGR